MKVTVVVPCFNAAQKIGVCLNSLLAIEMQKSDYEVIFVDDCSTDSTYDLLLDFCSSNKNWYVHRLDKNSGSPSYPRNYATKLARGKYVFYLDCDDEILPDTLSVHYEAASKNSADMVRGYLYASDGSKRLTMNRLPEWSDSLSRHERIKLFLEKQSLTKTCLIRTDLLREKNIKYPEDMKMGEDTVFVADVLCAANNVVYIDHPTYIYNRTPTFVQSTTQSFGEKELADQLLMWPRLQEVLSQEGVNYYSTRLHVNLRYIFSLLIQKNRRDIKESTFRRFSEFVRIVGEDLDRSKFSARHVEFVEAIEGGSFERFSKLARPRLLVAGYDLKFITPFFPVLSEYFEIRVDEWSGHSIHNEKHSKECLEWAEYIWCEWLLGNAVWYSERKKAHQKLIIRMHRFEVGQAYGSNISVKNVDAIITVSVLFFERLLESFPNIPRNKVRLMPLGYMIDEYEKSFFDERLYTIGMIGILPSGKGFHKALEILNELRKLDSRFKLEIFGKRPEDLSWIANDKDEKEYFLKCEKYISECGLSDAVHFNGHSNIKKSIAQRKVGFILSLSKQVRELPGFESFHIAVGDGYCGGAVSLVLHFLGAEYVWSQDSIFTSTDAIVDRIYKLSCDPEAFESASYRGRELIAARYSAQEFAGRVKSCFQQLAM